MSEQITPAMIQAAQDRVQGPDEDMYSSIYWAMRTAAPREIFTDHAVVTEPMIEAARSYLRYGVVEADTNIEMAISAAIQEMRATLVQAERLAP